MEYPEIAAAIQKLNDMFAGEGRVLIRPSRHRTPCARDD